MWDPSMTPGPILFAAREEGSTTMQQNQGRFIWHDLITGNPEAAEAFYSELFGWQIVPIDQGAAGIYRMLLQGDAPFGGIYGAEPTGWVSYIVTPDLDQTLEQVSALGGNAVSAPMELPDVGRFAVIDDPAGARFAMMETALPGIDPSATPAIGSIAFHELVTSGFEQSIAFYSALFGYAESPIPSAVGNYSLLMSEVDGAPAMTAGVFRQSPAGGPNTWMIYIRVGDIAATRQHALELGAQANGGINDIPGFGKTAWLTDPTGARFALREL